MSYSGFVQRGLARCDSHILRVWLLLCINTSCHLWFLTLNYYLARKKMHWKKMRWCYFVVVVALIHIWFSFALLAIIKANLNLIYDLVVCCLWINSIGEPCPTKHTHMYIPTPRHVSTSVGTVLTCDKFSSLRQPGYQSCNHFSPWSFPRSVSGPRD